MPGKCKHGIRSDWCAYCSGLMLAKATPRRAEHRAVVGTVHAAGVMSKEQVSAFGHVLISTHGTRYKTHAFDHLDDSVLLVHIDGHPFVWTIELILDRAPNVRKIQVIPTMRRKITETHLKLCRDHGVEIVAGHFRPEMAWKGERITSPSYAGQRNFLKSLTGEQKALFEELLALGFEEVRMAARYYCLDGGDYIPQHVVAAEYGYGDKNNSLVSRKINGILLYLDPGFQTGKDSRDWTERLKARVTRTRAVVEKENYREIFCRELGVDHLPEGLYPSQFEEYRTVVMAHQVGKVEALRSHDSRYVEILKMRFGLDGGRVRTLQEIGDLFGITRERIRQLEEMALELLGIASQDKE